MFIHIGEEIVIQSREIVAIFDYELYESSKETKEFLVFYEGMNQLITVGKELPKSIVLTTDRAYLSPLSSITLKRRALTGIDF